MYYILKIRQIYRPKNGGKYCIGDRVGYESCNIQVKYFNIFV
jgi:hypothetical protein